MGRLRLLAPAFGASSGSQYPNQSLRPVGAAGNGSMPLWRKPLPRLPAGAASISVAAIRCAASWADPAASRERGRAGPVDWRRLIRRSQSVWEPRPLPPLRVRADECPTAAADGDAAQFGGVESTDAAAVEQPGEGGPALQFSPARCAARFVTCTVFEVGNLKLK